MEQIASEFFIWIAMNYPVTGASFGAIITIYTAVKGIIALTPGKGDDKLLARFKKTWPGKVMEFITTIPFKKK